MSTDPRTHDPRAFGVGTEPPDAADAAQDLAETSARALWQRDAAGRALGVRVDEVGPGRAVLTMPVRADMLDPHGACHGGFVGALAESCIVYAGNSHGAPAVGVALQIEHLARAEAGERLRAEAVERARTDGQAVYDVTVTRADGATIALVRGRCRC